MRGRLFLPSFTGACVFGTLAFVRWHPGRGDLGVMVLSTEAVFFLAILVPPGQGWEINEKGITNERLYYDGYSLIRYIEEGELRGRTVDLGLAQSLARYAEICGPVTIHHTNPATLGYLAGPEVSFIDMLGLTDDVVAGLPSSEQVSPHPRPGHPTKWVPVSYLARRGDIALVGGWIEAVERLDCAYQAYPSRFIDSQERINPGIVFAPPEAGSTVR
jgi:hypothetical protein